MFVCIIWGLCVYIGMCSMCMCNAVWTDLHSTYVSLRCVVTGTSGPHRDST